MSIAPLSLKAGSTIPANRIVSSNGTPFTVNVASTVTAIPLGISEDTVLEVGQAIPIAGPGKIAYLEFNQTVSAGGLVAANSSGQGVAHTDVTAGSYVVGVALETVSATGTVAKVLVNPFFKSIP